MLPAEAGGDDYTQDGTVDLRGNPVRRSKRGRWTACSFIVGTLSLSRYPQPNKYDGEYASIARDKVRLKIE